MDNALNYLVGCVVQKRYNLPTYAIPQATDKPCPRDPVATSMKFKRGVGCPSRSESILRSCIKSSTGNCPTNAWAAYKIGAAWPLDKMNLSLLASFGLLLSNLKKNEQIWVKLSKSYLVCYFQAGKYSR